MLDVKTMSRAYVIYFLMFVSLVGGLAVVMNLGDAVDAPDDLAGDWAVEWDNALPPGAGEPTMHIDQSGRFFVVRFGHARPLSMTLRENWTGRPHGRKLDMKLSRSLWTMRVSGEIPPKQEFRVPEVAIELVGPTRHVGKARRLKPEEVAADGAKPTNTPAGTAHAR
jgi:hypothetical protein